MARNIAATLRLGGDDGELIRGGRGVDLIFGKGGDDIIDGAGGADLLSGGDGADQILGGAQRDVLIGGAGDDRLFGEKGRDVLSGGEGVDQLDGGRGADLLSGGVGADRLTGGRGADSFAFADGEGGDVIADFEIGADRFILDAASFGVTDELAFQNVARDGEGTDAALVGVEGGKTVYVLQGGFQNAGQAQAALAAELAQNDIDEGAGFFVYFNVNLGVNRLFAVDDLDVAGGIQQLANLGDNLTGDAADLAAFTAANFAFADALIA